MISKVLNIRIIVNLLMLQIILLQQNVVAQNGFMQHSVDSLIIPNGNLATSNSITTDLIGNKLIGTSGYGLLLYNGTGWINYNTSNSGIAFQQIKHVAVDDNNTYWMATYGGGLSKFDGTNWTTFNQSNSGICSNKLTFVLCNSNLVYIGSEFGISIFNKNTGVFNNYNTINSNLSSDTITSICFDFDNTIWIGTNNGLCSYQSGTFTKFHIGNSGLLDNTILSLYHDGIDLWIGTKTKSLHRYSSNQIKNIQQIFDTPIIFIGNGVNSKPIYSITMGPLGGVLFSINGNRFIEIFHDKLYNYDNTNSTPVLFSTKTYLSYDNVNQSLWITGMYHKLHSFKSQNYNGFVLSNSFNNYKSLDINEVSAAITDRGDMFWDVDLQKPNYKIPKDQEKSAIFSAGLWLGGLDVSGNLHLAGQTYRQTGVDYWAGPLDTITAQTDSATVAAYDKIWKISWFDIEQFKYFYDIGQVQNGSWTPSIDILTWPARGSNNITRNLAPFVDVNNNGIYDPINDGDYPKIKGDQMLYWIFNDNLSTHTETGGMPLGVEVHASAYSFGCPELITVDSCINYTTFYHFEVYNRSNSNYDSCYISNVLDIDIGFASDDAIACNPDYNIAFGYNFDNTDEGELGYGLNPPVIGQVILNGPLAYENDGIDNNNNGSIDENDEVNLMSSCIFFSNNSNAISGNPLAGSPDEFYNYLKANWRNNNHLTLGGDGIVGTQSTNFMFSGIYEDTIPWFPSAPTDYRAVQGTGPFAFNSKSKFDFDFAICYAKDTVGNDNPILFQQLFNNAQSAKNWFLSGSFPSCLGTNALSINDSVPSPNLTLYPNPCVNILNFQLKQHIAVKSYQVYDIFGKLILEDRNVNTATVSTQFLTNGMYILKINTVAGESLNHKFLKQ